MVSQVPIIGILMIVNGVLCILYGIVQMALAPLMHSIFAMQAAQGPPQAQQQMQLLMEFSFWVYVALGIANAVTGLLSIIGGIPAMRYRYRTLVIVALCANVGSFLSCYCLPTSLGLMIWGLIVMFQKDVAEAFKLGAAGVSVDEIKQRLADDRRRREYDYDDEDDRDARQSRHTRGVGGSEGPPPEGPPKGPEQGTDGIREL